MSDAIQKVHRASQHRPEHAKHKGTFRTFYTMCAVTPGMKRLATNRASDVTCALCAGKAVRKPKPKPPKREDIIEQLKAEIRSLKETISRIETHDIHPSIVVDKPDHPVAAPCAIEHCKYFELEETAKTFAKAHAETLVQLEPAVIPGVYRLMTVEQLRVLHEAFTLDMQELAAGEDIVDENRTFCEQRLAAIDAELARREEK